MRNAYVYTVNAEHSVAEAVAIHDGKILAVRSNADIEPYIGQDTKVRDLDGPMLMPGIHGVHIHAMGTVERDSCDLRSEPYSLAQLVPVLKDCITRLALEPGEWLIVHQSSYTAGNQQSAELPTLRAALDAASTAHPILLLGNDGHHGAANSAALAQARDDSGTVVGMNAATLKGMFSGSREYVAMDASGEPSGGVNEGARLLLFPGLFSTLLGGGEDPEALMPKVAVVLARSDITSIQDPAAAPEALDAYRWLENQGGMTFRMRAGLYVRPQNSHAEGAEEQIPELIQRLQEVRERVKGSRLIRADGVKLFADGVLEGNPLSEPPTLPNAAVLNGFHQPRFTIDQAAHTVIITGYVDPNLPKCTQYRADEAALSTPQAIEQFRSTHGYPPSQCITGSGVLEHSEAFIHAFVREATKAEFNVHIHALADRGVRVSVDALEAAKADADRQGLSQSLAHMQLVHPGEQRRIGELRIFATFTYAWMVAEPTYNLTVIPFIEKLSDPAGLFNPDTYYIRNVYPVKSIVDHKGIATFGSDAPLESRDPRVFINLEQAVTRAWETNVLNAPNAIDIHTALAAFSINGTKQLGISDSTGSIDTGKFADLIMLDRNPITLAEQGKATEISETQVMLTVFEGRIVHEA
ncbi:MAG: amidohydrolase family protein [Gammaproteobacteria bacterium]|nr:amidohydrolase family protein [Gammaproteobacteria bacterium]